MASESQVIQIPCESCDGRGYYIVTADMASDAGEPSMAGMQEQCGACRGQGCHYELALADAAQGEK